MDWKIDSSLEDSLNTFSLKGYTRKQMLIEVKKNYPLYSWSLATLKRRLSFFNIRRHDTGVSMDTLVSAVKEELKGPNSLFGIKAMHTVIRTKHKLKVTRDSVEHVLNILDPQGLEERKLTPGKRLQFVKRVFVSKGPNWIWSLDGHDKLMGLYKNQFPLGIHGCVDTFSRKIIWLQAWPGNSSPILPAALYLNALEEYGVVPRFIRSDKGNENCFLFRIQNFLRENMTGDAFIYGSSVTNQTIERFWSDYRKRNGDFFKQALIDLVATGDYNESCDTQRVLLACLFIPMLQRALDDFKEYHNSHRIRKQKGVNRPCGIPDFVHDNPEHYGFENQGCVYQEKRLKFLKQKLNLSRPIEFVCSKIMNYLYALLETRFDEINTENILDAYKFLKSSCINENIKLEFKKFN